MNQPVIPVNDSDQSACADDLGSAVEVKNLSRRFRRTQALDRVNLRIPTGSVFGLVGLNGAGKTTLIRHLIGSFRPQSGSVHVLGGCPVDTPETINKRLGYLTEEDSLPKWMQVGDLMDFTRAIYPTWDDGYATALLKQFGLSRNDPLQSLSKGLRARAGLLAAIAHRPELLILDEPSSGLDPLARSDILEAIIRAVNEEGRTVLFSSHLLDEVDRVCDTLALMREGQIVETTTVEQLESRYREIVCKFTSLSTPPAVDSGHGPQQNISGVFGWRRQGEEWSGVVDQQAVSVETVKADEGLTVISDRAITLDRWFSARAISESEAVDHV